MACGIVDSRIAAANRRVFFSSAGNCAGGVFGGRPGVGKARGVVVAEEDIFVAGRGAPSAAAWGAIGKMPGEQEGVIGVRSGGDGSADGEGSYRAGILRLGPEFAIGGEIVPEEHGRIPPRAALPSAQVRQVRACGIEGGEHEASLERVVGGELGITHEEAGELAGRAVLVDARVGVPMVSRGVLDGPGDGNFGGRGAGIGDTIPEDRDGQSGFIGLVRDERRKGFERDFHRQSGIGKIHAGEREFAGESGGCQAGEAGSVVGTEAARSGIGRLQARFEHAGDGLAVAGLRPDGGERVRGGVPFVRPIENFPVAELAASAEADGAGADTAQWKADGGEPSSGEGARVSDLGSGGRGRCRRGRRLRGDGGGCAGERHLFEKGPALRGHQI